MVLGSPTITLQAQCNNMCHRSFELADACMDGSAGMEAASFYVTVDEKADLLI